MASNVYEKRRSVLELETRQTLFDIVKQNSGCHFREIERRSKMAHGTVKYHLHFLVKHELIVEKKDGKNVRYFPRETKENFEILAFLRQRSTRQIILFLTENEKATHGEIGEFVGLSGATVSWHLKKLVQRGIVARETGRYSLKYPRGEIGRLLISFRESFFDALVDRVIEMWDVR